MWDPDFEPRIAYFSMEIGLESSIPTYGGGLGVLAGDTIRSAADLELPLVAVSLLHRRGYFYQSIDAEGRQQEKPVSWSVDDHLEPIEIRTSIEVDGAEIQVRPWLYRVGGRTDREVPVLLLDTDLEENPPWARELTDELYGRDDRYRLSQEAVLGLGGVKILRTLGFGAIDRYHLNEGHAALLIAGLLEEALPATDDPPCPPRIVDRVRSQCVFTTHTPVPAGHDQFDFGLAEQLLGRHFAYIRPIVEKQGALNMTYLALRMSRFVNGVARKHAEVSRKMFAGYEIESITNGVHVGTWVSEPFAHLLDEYVSGWGADPARIRYARSIPLEEIWAAHREVKSKLIRHVNRTVNAGMDEDVFTIGYGRRMTRYKRPELLVSDPDRLARIATDRGPLQIIFAGKAHPRDEQGQDLIQQIHRVRSELPPQVCLAYLENYDMNLAGLMTAGTDLWLNTPEPPNEASGTSGMKAALNAVPQLSTLDGWWIEGHIEGVTGWAIDGKPGTPAPPEADVLYGLLEDPIVPLFYRGRDRYGEVMRDALALNGSFFTTERMMREYRTNAYRL